MGATVIVETKSGANQIHGSAYEFLRNGDVDATSFFSVGQKKPPFHQNQFGGTFGGHIIRNKLFYFGSAESLRIVQGPAVSPPCLPMRARRQFRGTRHDFRSRVNHGRRQRRHPDTFSPVTLFPPAGSIRWRPK